LAAVPAEGSSLSDLSFSVSTVSLFKYLFEHRVLLRIGEKLADPNDLLEPLIFANLKNDLLGARDVGREPVIPINKERDIVVPRSEGRGRNLAPRKARTPVRFRKIAN
jgi:hypothetical protein